MSEHRHRRAWLVVSTTLAVMLLAAACNRGTESGDSTDTGAADASESSGPWTFTDGRGETITLDEPPTKIVANTEFAVPPLLHMGIEPIAAFGDSKPEDAVSLQGLDTTGIDTVGTVDGEIDVEKLAALDPDLIVTTVTDPYVTGFADKAQVKLVENIAPVVALDALKPTSEALDDWLDLGVALGADLETSEMQAAKARYESAKQAVQDATAANPDLTFIYAALIPDAVYVANPDIWGDLRELQSLGLNFLKPEKLRGDAFWNDGVSWERVADEFPADVILWDARPYTSYLPPDERTDLPAIWERLPAVEAGQYGPWRALWNTSWDVYADNLEELAALIESSTPVNS